MRCSLGRWQQQASGQKRSSSHEADGPCLTLATLVVSVGCARAEMGYNTEGLPCLTRLYSCPVRRTTCDSPARAFGYADHRPLATGHCRCTTGAIGAIGAAVSRRRHEVWQHAHGRTSAAYGMGTNEMMTVCMRSTVVRCEAAHHQSGTALVASSHLVQHRP
jgi:hypothetical protein